jgi:hypothetical protein
VLSYLSVDETLAFADCFTPQASTLGLFEDNFDPFRYFFFIHT